MFWWGLFFLIFYFFDMYGAWRGLPAFLQARVHVFMVFVIMWMTQRFTDTQSAAELGLEIGSGGHTFNYWIFYVWFILPGFMIGRYFLLSLNAYGEQWNEAFSSLRIPDWKHFIRLHIGKDGALTIFPIGIWRVPRVWRNDDTNGRTYYVPADPRATDLELIEQPMTLRSRSAA